MRSAARWIAWSWRRLVVWGVRRRVTRWRISIVRAGQSRALAELARWIQRGGLDERTGLQREAEALLGAAVDELRGRRVRTYHRLEFREMDAAEACDALSTRPQGQALLAKLVELLQPDRVVELGSAFGVGSLTIALALRKNPRSRFDGIELETWKAELAHGLVERVLGARGQVHGGSIEEVLPRLLGDSLDPPDFAFVDAEHTYRAMRAYHELIARSVATGGVVVYDDILWSPGMMRFWDELVTGQCITDAVVIDGQWGIVRYRAPRAASPAK